MKKYISCYKENNFQLFFENFLKIHPEKSVGTILAQISPNIKRQIPKSI